MTKIIEYTDINIITKDGNLKKFDIEVPKNWDKIQEEICDWSKPLGSFFQIKSGVDYNAQTNEASLVFLSMFSEGLNTSEFKSSDVVRYYRAVRFTTFDKIDVEATIAYLCNYAKAEVKADDTTIDFLIGKELGLTND